MVLIKDGYHLPILAHKYELLPTYSNILMCELHSELQTQYSIFFRTGIPKNDDEYDSSGIYGCTCATCHLKYLGQTGRILKQCYSKHIQYIRYNNPQSAVANHILQHGQEYGTIQSTVTLTLKGTLWTFRNNPVFKNIAMSIRWFRNKYQVEIIPCLPFLMMYNYVKLLYELVHAYSLILQSCGCCITHWYVLMTFTIPSIM